MISVAPQIGSSSLVMTGEDVLPVPFSEFCEIKLFDGAQALITVIPSEVVLVQVLSREVHALEFVKQTNISKQSI